jgi:hypothetical protein
VDDVGLDAVLRVGAAVVRLAVVGFAVVGFAVVGWELGAAVVGRALGVVGPVASSCPPLLSTGTRTAVTPASTSTRSPASSAVRRLLPGRGAAVGSSVGGFGA